MSVLVDTSVWSLALRRKSRNLNPNERAAVHELEELIAAGAVNLLGVVRQELLSGISSAAAFERLRSHLRHFDDLPVETDDYEEAARCANRCRARGIAGTAFDFLICGVALRRDLAVFTTDADFGRYAMSVPLRLYRPKPR